MALGSDANGGTLLITLCISWQVRYAWKENMINNKYNLQQRDVRFLPESSGHCSDDGLFLFKFLEGKQTEQMLPIISIKLSPVLKF